MAEALGRAWRGRGGLVVAVYVGVGVDGWYTWEGVVISVCVYFRILQLLCVYSYLVCHTRGGSEGRRCIRRIAEEAASFLSDSIAPIIHCRELYLPAAAGIHRHNAAAEAAPAGSRRRTAVAGERSRIVVVWRRC